jgi:2-haloacid dehalogenase
MRWVSFDCFGTLVDWNGGFAAILTPIAGSKTADLIREYHRAEAVLERETPHRSYKDVLAGALTRAAAEVGVQLTSTQAGLLTDSWASLGVFDDVERMLAGLRAMGCRLAVLTNCDEDLFERTHQSFRAPFDLVVTAERVRDYKPSPSHFRYFARTSGVDERTDWVHVANSWYHDIAPARDLGILHLWLDREGGTTSRKHEPGASPRVHSANEVCGAVAALFGTREESA